MTIFFSVILYFGLIGLTIFLSFKLIKLTKTIKTHKEFINKLDAQLYKDLRKIQFVSFDITRQANKYLNDGFSFIGEILSTFLISLLPFKKLKSIIYLKKVLKKII